MDVYMDLKTFINKTGNGDTLWACAYSNVVEYEDLADFIGRTITTIKFSSDDDYILMTFSNGDVLAFYHEQSCCESVTIEDISGDLRNLIGSPLTMCEIVTSDVSPNGDDLENSYDSCTWTFYKFATVKGYVTIRWFGESNGYYSERVSAYLWRNPMPEREKKPYIISLIGCDDQTDFKMELTDNELDLLKRVAAKSVETSTYGCMPIMELIECTNDCKNCARRYYACAQEENKE